MKERKLSPRRMSEERARLEVRPLYVPADEGRATVRFRLMLSQPPQEETLLVMFSNRVRAVVYIGPYAPEVSIEADSRLMTGNGYDSLEFVLLRLDSNVICSWMNERGYPYWRPDGEAEITLRDEGGFDEDGLFMAHEVTLA